MNELEAVAAVTKRKIVEIVSNDPHAPRYHFISPTPHNECFDPNGAIFWKGRYHLFYIFQDSKYRTGPEFWQHGHCWGHASSADLVHWEHHPVALTPEPGDPEVAIYSGCALVNKEGVPTLVYHGYNAGTCIATAADDDLIGWNKSPHNPVIPEPKQEGDPGWGVYNVFDPHVWLDGDTYYAILGGMVKPHDKHDTAYLFRSNDLMHWEYLHPFYQPRHEWTSDGDDCACPDFFHLGVRPVLLCISHATGARYYRGRYEHNTFFPEDHHPMNWPGGDCFAPETLLDDKDRRILWAWAVDQRRPDPEQNIVGVMTLPRVLSVDEHGVVRIEPAPELAALRRNHRRFDDIALVAGVELPLEQVNGDCLELTVVADVEPATRFGLKLRVAPDGREQTMLAFDAAAGEFLIDTTHSSLDDNGWRPSPMDFWRGHPAKNLTVQHMPFVLPPGEPLKLHIFLDRSILEVFVNDRHCMTQRIYPTQAASREVMLFAEGAGARVRYIDAWDMGAVNSGEQISNRH